MRHAYMIMAHNKMDQLKQLVELLDHSSNDIYIHIDRKCTETVSISTNNARVQIVDKPLSVTWGGYSQIEVELMLLKCALRDRSHDYYHLLSGSDVPIKTHAQIEQFFETHNGAEFISFQESDYTAELRYKVGTYHLFQDIAGRSEKFALRVLSKLDSMFANLQIKCKYDRRESGVVYSKGDNWFSITEDCARYVVAKEPWIVKNFRMTRCGDEVFLQTVVLNSKFKDNLYKGKYNSLRYIDWKRGQPYTFTSDDYSELLKAPQDALYARKIDSSIDRAIISQLYAEI